MAGDGPTHDDNKEDREIEVTPEMIKAGASALACADETFGDYPFELLKLIVADVYVVMVAVGRDMSAAALSRKKHKSRARKDRPTSTQV